MAVGRPGTARRTALTVAIAAACAVASLCAAAAGAATPANWTAPADLSASGRDAREPLVAMDPAGNITAVWERQTVSGVGSVVQVSTRPAGGAFSPAVDLAQLATEPRMAMAPNGDLYVVWREFVGSRYEIRMATKPAGGTLSAPVQVHEAPAGGAPSEIQVAVGAGGDVAVTWIDTDPSKPFAHLICEYIFGKPIYCSNPPFVLAAVREAGETAFEPAVRLYPQRGIPPEEESMEEEEERLKTESKTKAYGPQLALDPAGNLIVAYTYGEDDLNSARYSFRPANGSFLPSEPLSGPGEGASVVGVGMDAAGNAVAAWSVEAGAPHALKAAVRPSGGSLQQLGAVSTPGQAIQDSSLAVAQDGTATLLWRTHDIGAAVVQTSVRPPGGSFLPPAQVSSGVDNPRFPRLARNAAGHEMVVWSGDLGVNKVARASVRAAGGGYSTPVAISSAAQAAFRSVPALDASGNGAVVWVRDIGGSDIVQVAGYDGLAPQLSEVSIPSQATVGQTIGVSSSASDLWGAPAIATAFGDDNQALGPSVSHAYSAPGTYTIRVTATDAVGRTAASSGTIAVKARNFFTIGKLKRNRKKGTATLTVEIPEPGGVTASAKGLRRASARASAAGSVTLLLKASGKALKGLRRKGRLRARLRITYLPDGGDPNTRELRVTLKKTVSGQGRGGTRGSSRP